MALPSVLAVTPTRPVFQDIGPAGKAVFYVAGTVAIAVFCWGMWLRVRKYRRGRPAGRWPTIRQALAGRSRMGSAGGIKRPDTRTVGTLASNKTIGRGDRALGLAHFLIFWGFLVAFAATVILTIDVDIVRNLSRLIAGHEDSFFHGPFFLVYTFAVDTMGFAFLAALVYMALRRGVRRPWRLGYARAHQPDGGYSRKRLMAGDWVFLGLLLAILVTAYLLTGLRILSQGMPWFTLFSPFGRLAAEMFSGFGMTPAAAVTAHTVLWWVHAALALSFVAYIPFSKAMHMLLDMANLLATDRGATPNLPAPIEGQPGYQTLADFTWKELLDFDACTKCGRCHEVCPARTAGAPLSPRDLILDLRQWADAGSGGHTLLDREQRPEPTGPLAAADGVRIAGDVVDERTLWSCTTCMHCVEVCPVGIEHVPTIVQLRRSLVDEGAMDPTLQTALQNLATQGNSFGKSARMRARWTKGLDFQIPDARKQPVKYLWFVGDFASFDDRLQENSRTLAKILRTAGVDFGLLYDAERNAGNDVRRVGEEGLFEMLAEQNIETLRQAQFEEIFTTDPHSLNTLRNEYPERGASYKVWHYTELLAHLLETGAIQARKLGYKVTYHDPCYLARYNGVTEAPRRILRALGCELAEMPRNGVNTFCCGAGGGRIWMDDSFLTERPSENRIKEAVTLDVSQFVVACPKDVTMYSDAAKTTGHDGTLAVRDITLLVAEAMAEPAEPLAEQVTA
ncbi:MAG: heterodisulfide reductase-related iron-sulfur binding cluster [Gemmatimonadota bacterium]